MTAAQLREVIPELTGTTEDTTLATLIARVDAAFARYCGYPPATAIATPTLESASYVLYLTGAGTRFLTLPIRPVTAVASVYDDLDLDFNDAADLVASADYALRWDPARGQQLVLTSTSAHGSWSTAAGAIKLTCTAGFTTVPSDILEAVRLAARQWWDRRKRRGKTSVSDNGGSIQYADEDILTDEVKALLGSFRLPSTAIGGGWA